MSAYDKYEAVIGLEVHAQLLTETKAFSPDSAAFGAGPNTHVDPVSLGHPGTLPVLNERVVDFTLRMGLSTHCRIAKHSIFARKHYFYPDLPKGYQISQYETPICYDGHVDIDIEPEGDGEAASGRKRIRIKRIHMEEDAGKSIHDQDPYDTLMDYNRCGVPLIEIVTEPDISSPREAYQYLSKIRQIVRYLGICDGNMEEGSLRCDANVSVRLKGAEALGTKTELKNMNSFRNVERALEFEIQRQMELIDRGGTVTQQTLLWDANRLETRPMRSKEEAHDYRYFPDPDLAPVVVTDEMLEGVRAGLPELPEQRRNRFVSTLNLPEYDAAILTEERALADYFESALDERGDVEPETFAKAVSNFVMTHVQRVLNERALSVADFPIEPSRLAELVHLRLDDAVSSTGAQEIFEMMLTSGERPRTLAANHDLLQVSDEGALLPIVMEVLDEHPKQLGMYLGGKEGLLGFFVGQVMRRFPGSPDPRKVKELLSEKIKERA